MQVRVNMIIDVPDNWSYVEIADVITESLSAQAGLDIPEFKYISKHPEL